MIKTFRLLLGLPLLTVSLVPISGSGIGWAQTTSEATQAHAVRRGDTLWDLAGTYLEDPFLWPLIFEANKEKIGNPHWIYPGQEFVIPPLGEARSRPASAGPVAFPGEQTQAPQAPVPGEGSLPSRAGEARAEALPTMVPRALAFSGGYISTGKERELGSIAGTPEEASNLTTYHKVYLNLGTQEGVKVGDRFTVYRWGPRVGHPRTHRGLGWIFDPLGVIQVTNVETRRAEAQILESTEAIHIGDSFKPYQEVLVPQNLSLYPVTEPVKGVIVAVKNKEHISVTHEVAFIDAGRSQGIMPGDIFDVYHPRRGHAPETVVGALQVLSVQQETATAYLVASATTDIHVGDPIRLSQRARGPE